MDFFYLEFVKYFDWTLLRLQIFQFPDCGVVKWFRFSYFSVDGEFHEKIFNLNFDLRLSCYWNHILSNTEHTQSIYWPKYRFFMIYHQFQLRIQNLCAVFRFLFGWKPVFLRIRKSSTKTQIIGKWKVWRELRFQFSSSILMELLYSFFTLQCIEPSCVMWCKNIIYIRIEKS